jgi:hypothetical protein
MFLVNYAGADFYTNTAGISFFVFLLLVNCLGLLMRQERLPNGGKWFTWDEVRDFKELAARQADPFKRVAYTIIRYVFNTCFILMFVIPLLLLGIGFLRSHLH